MTGTTSQSLNSQRGSVGIYFSFGVGSITFGVDQERKVSNSVSWGNQFFSIGADPDVDGAGWSLPLGIVSVGETYQLDGRYGTFSVGTPLVGITFSVHAENDTSRAIGPDIVDESVDTNGDRIGYTYVEQVMLDGVPHYRITDVNLDLKPIGVPRYAEIPVENQQYYSSGIPPHCFPADTPIAVSLTETRPISELRVGDTVLAFDPGAELGRGALVPRRVVRLYRNTTEAWVRLSWEEGGEAKELVATPGHHVLDRFGGFRTIGEMVSGGRATVVLASGELAEVTAERIVYSAETAHLFERAQAVGMIPGNTAQKPPPLRFVT